ncbi:repressor LexA [Rhizobiales bacterium GAS188]|nr:repressor LexA [Rhizobiales bacterium GAS188]
MEIGDIERALHKPGKSKSGLAAALGRQPSAVTALLKGERKLKADEVPVIKAYLEMDDGAPLTIPIMGDVGAGSEAHFYDQAQGPFGEIAAPQGSTDETVAVRIKGESLGNMFDGWFAVYDDRREPVTPDLHGQLCVVGLPDGRVLIKKLTPSKSGNGLFHLYGQNGDPILDTPIEWAARVRLITRS